MTFVRAAPDAKLCGAGVVCYAVHRGQLWLLLGRERETANWKFGSGRWSSFSGRAEVGETPSQAAAREFVEESCAAVGIEEGAALPTSVEDVARVLASRVPSTVLERAFHLRPPGGGARAAAEVTVRHVTFVRRISYNPELVARFDDMRRKLLQLDAAFRPLLCARKSCESAARLLLPGFASSACVVTRRVTLLGDPPAGDSPGERQQQAAHALAAGTRPPGGARRVLVSLQDGDEAECCDVELDISAAAAAELGRARRAAEAARAVVEAFAGDPVLNHPAIRAALQTPPEEWIASAPCVNRAFLEKSEIRWFSATELRRARNDRSLGDMFRRCFLETLPHILKKIFAAETPQRQFLKPLAGAPAQPRPLL